MKHTSDQFEHHEEAADVPAFAVSVVGGPTTVIDMAGRRLVVDPTFDPPGDHGYLTKTVGPAISADAIAPVDVVLISHDQHADHLDTEGRRFALAAPLVITHSRAADRLGPPARGLHRWEAVESPPAAGMDALTVQAVPAVHGPADGQRDETGNINCEVTGFVLSSPAGPTVYLSGDNASIAAIAEIAEQTGPVDVAVLFVGAARVPAKERGRALTLTSERAAAAAELLRAKVVIPAHVDGWAHVSEGVDAVVEAFDDAGIGDKLVLAAPGEWVRRDYS